MKTCCYFVSFLSVILCSGLFSQEKTGVQSDSVNTKQSPIIRPDGLILSGDTAFTKVSYEYFRSDPKNRDTTDPVPPDFVPYTKEPTVQKQVTPVYPPEALAAKLEGLVIIKIWIDKNGNPRLAIIKETTNKIFNETALAAVMQWKFTPAYIHDEPQSIWVSVPCRYRLN